MRENFSVFFKNSSDLIAVAGTNGMFVEVNPAWTEILGFSQDELLKASYFGLLHADDRAEATAIVERITRESRSGTVVGKFKTKSGYYRLLHSSITPDSHGQIFV